MNILTRGIEIFGSITVLFLFFSGMAVAIILTVGATGRFFRSYGKGSSRNLYRTEIGSDSKGHSPFGSLCLALAGTLGVGNVSGVASAISVGGAGAVFWMWVSAVFCSALKYAEVVLAIRFRKRTADGGYEGGAHYYLKHG